MHGIYGLNTRTGILDNLREGFPWPARPFKHAETNSFNYTFEYMDGTGVSYYLRYLVVWPALHIFQTFVTCVFLQPPRDLLMSIRILFSKKNSDIMVRCRTNSNRLVVPPHCRTCGHTSFCCWYKWWFILLSRLYTCEISWWFTMIYPDLISGSLELVP